MADPLFDQLSASTLADMAADIVQDNFFVDGAYQRLMRHYAVNDPYRGGLFAQEPFMYDRVNGGASAPGAERQVIQKQILAAMQFYEREYTYDIPMNEWVAEVVNNGPAAMVSILDTYMANAVDSFATDANIDFYWHGQAQSTTVGQNRSIYSNGADEAISNGIDPGWLGNVYTTYGGQLRNGVANTTLNAQPLWAGDQNGGPGQANYGTLLQGYLNCVQPPDTGLCNKACFQYIAQRVQPQQRFVEEGGISTEKDVRIGLTGFKIMDAYIHVDKLAPSTRFGALLPTNLSQTTSITPQNFTTPSTVTAASGYPASTLCKPGEPFFWFRLQDWKMRPAASPRYNHHFSPKIYSQTNADLYVIFYQSAFNQYTPSPRDNSQIVGFGY